MKKKTILEKIISENEEMIDTVDFIQLYKELNERNKEKLNYFILGVSYAEKR